MPEPTREGVAACVCDHAQVEHRAFGGLVAYAECKVEGCPCKHYVSRTPDAATTLHVGQHVRALSSWEGYVSKISDEEACGQGRLVTCYPITLPAAPPGGRPWKPITVTEAELTPTGRRGLIAERLAEQFGGDRG